MVRIQQLAKSLVQLPRTAYTYPCLGAHWSFIPAISLSHPWICLLYWQNLLFNWLLQVSCPKSGWRNHLRSRLPRLIRAVNCHNWNVVEILSHVKSETISFLISLKFNTLKIS